MSAQAQPLKSALKKKPGDDLGLGAGTLPPKNIFEAAERGLPGYITRIIERSLEFNINVRDKFQRTALHWAAEAGHIDAAECLIDYGIDINATECNGRTAVHLAARSAKANMLKLLMTGKSKQEMEQMANQPDFFGLTPVFLALQKGDDGLETLNFLMNSGGRYNQQAPTKFVDASHGKFEDPAEVPKTAA